MTTEDVIRSERRGAALWVTLEGEVDMANAATVETRLRDAVTQDVDRVVLDLEALTFLDSSGVRMLVVLATGLRERRKDMAVVVPDHGIVRRVLSIAGVDSLVRVLPSRDAADEWVSADA
jgi:anti-anti-sigma factor